MYAVTTYSPARLGQRQALRRLWLSRELVRRLVLRDLMVRYQRSTLGFAWTLLNPLVTVAVLLVVFTRVVPVGVPRYWAFLLSGYFVWNFVANTLNASAFTIHDHADMTRNMPFSVETLMIGSALARLVEFVAALTLVALALALFHHRGIPASYALLPLLAVLQLLLVLGLAFLVATLSVFYYDVQHALPVALMLVVYVSPVFYPASYVPLAFRPLFFLNPVAGLLTLYQTVLYEGRLPHITLLAGTTIFALLICSAGYVILGRYRAVIAETV